MIKPYLEVGEVVSTHGVHGELRVQPWCDSADFIKQFKTLYCDKQGSKPVKVVSCRTHATLALVKLEGVDTVEAASALRGKVLYMDRRDAKLAPGANYVQDLLDCRVVDADDDSIIYGVISDVSRTGANDVWHVKSDGKEYLLPAIPSVVIDTDVVGGVVKIRPLKGIFDDAD